MSTEYEKLVAARNCPLFDYSSGELVQEQQTVRAPLPREDKDYDSFYRDLGRTVAYIIGVDPRSLAAWPEIEFRVMRINRDR